MYRVFANISRADAAIKVCFHNFEKAFSKERNSIFEMIKQHTFFPKFATDAAGTVHKNPISSEMKTFDDMLHQRIDQEHEKYRKSANDYVQNQVNVWMKIILDNAHDQSFDVNRHISRCLTSILFQRQYLSEIHVSVLCDFFLQKIQKIEGIADSDRQKFERSRPVFERFHQDIQRRAHEIPFKLYSLIQDFNIHFVSAKRGLDFYRESAFDLLEAVRNNDVCVVATPTGR
jgi:hypothetical protein